MASLSKYHGGWRVQLATEGRPSIYLGNVPESKAEAFRGHANLLESCVGHPELVPDKTLRWALALDEKPYNKLAAAGLLPARQAKVEAPTVGKLGDAIRHEVASLKLNTRNFYDVVIRMMEQKLPPATPVAMVTHKEADDLVAWMRDKSERGAGLDKATVARRIKALRKIFGRACRWGWLPSNPFEGIKAGLSVNHARQAFVPMADFQKLVDACPDLEFRCVLALSRLAALRTPSEILQLRWLDVRWDSRELFVRSPKTEAHEGGASRIVPLFPELGAILAAWQLEAPEGAEYVVSHRQGAKANWRTKLSRLIVKAGVKGWPKLFQNLRASRESELVKKYPLADVCRWLGHTPQVAATHYLMQTDNASFQDAVEAPKANVAQNVAHPGVESGGKRHPAPVRIAANSLEMVNSGGGAPPSQCAQQDSNAIANAGEGAGGAEDSANCSATPLEGRKDEQLERLVQLWPGLSPDLRAELVALAESGGAGGTG